jgi:hypothetical protein
MVQDKGQYPCGYLSHVAHGDVFLWNNWKTGPYGSQLGIAGDKLSQKTLWRFGGRCAANGPPNFVLFDDLLCVKGSPGRKPAKGKGYAMLDPQTGKIIRQGSVSGWAAFASGTVVSRGGGRLRGANDKTENKVANPSRVPGFGLNSFGFNTLPDLKSAGYGYLCPEAPAGDVAERHIATIGTSRVVPTRAGISCWGNRIFIRDNDYLWCIGDPKAAYLSPEECMK